MRSADPWPAPHPLGPVDGTVRVPGSKSLTARWLVLAALAQAPSTLHGVLDSRDSQLMMRALTQLGARFSWEGTGTVHVTPLGADAQGGAETEPVHVDCGLAGTVMRFVPPVAALRAGQVHFDGDAEARLRPVGAVLDALGQLGVDVEPAGAAALPFRVSGGGVGSGSGGVRGGRVEIDASGSSQFISALLLTAPRLPEGLEVVHTGTSVPSPEHIGMTVEVLRQAGAVVDDSVPGRWSVSPGPLTLGEVTVEPDLSNAGPFLAAAVATGGTVRIPDWPLHTTQIGDRWRHILPQFGATVELVPEQDGVGAAGDGDPREAGHGDPREAGHGDPREAGHSGRTGTLVVTGRVHDDGPRRGQPRIDGPGEIPGTAELAPTVAALCLLAEGPAQITGIGHLRGHETDRLAALATEGARIGAVVREGADRLDVEPVPRERLHGAVMDTYHDHRMATFAAVVGLGVPGVEITDVATTAKTMPDFPQMWTDLVGTAAPAPEAQT